MRKLRYPHLLAAAAVGSLVLLTPPAPASPIAAGMNAAAMPPVMSGGLVEKAHGWHCRKRKGWYRGKSRLHRHQKACRDYHHSQRYRRYPPLPYYGYGEFGFPYDEWQWERRTWLWD